jgi:methylenetetrahydrofolate--tRNA-(uracil-5-)-methyltransferase
MEADVTIIGGGLAGAEAAWQAARAGCRVELCEMRPVLLTPAHQTGFLAELVCSNSLKSDLPGTASYLLKEELRRMGSLLMRIADETRVPAGHALAVDRERFCRRVTEEIAGNTRIRIVRGEVTAIPERGVVIVATGPLTSGALSQAIAGFTGTSHLYFYDAISPIVEASTLDATKVYAASRYGKGGSDYLNAPMNREEYERFYGALVAAESVPLHEFESAMYFEGCLPIEELARRGVDTLRFGPMKPVGLIDPRTNRRPYAVVQLRQENLMADSYNLVGFQNHLRFPEQQRVFRMIPGLERAEFLRFGQIHRNTFISAPAILDGTLQAKSRPGLFFAGQICGVEGYVESIATGLLAGSNASRFVRGETTLTAPPNTACGSLMHYLRSAPPENFQPANISFGLMPEPAEEIRSIRDKKLRHTKQVEAALETMDGWIQMLHHLPAADGAMQ